jgi:hypothetical protein
MNRQETEKSDKMNDGLIVDYEVFRKVTRNVLLNANVFRHKNIRTSHGTHPIQSENTVIVKQTNSDQKDAELAFGTA